MSDPHGPPLHLPALVALGNFFFRYRNAIFPVVLFLLVVVARPRAMFDDPALSRSWILLGGVLALLGEGFRLFTIGYDYIDRGGRGGMVSASRLVQGGLYAHVRNPMYVGNLLIAAGLLLYSSSWSALVTALPFFVLVYAAIIAAEETYLLKTFGAEFEAYVSRVPAFLPSWKGLGAKLAGARYDWKRALRKDYGNIFFVAMSFLILSWWRVYFLKGPTAAAGLTRTNLLLTLVFTSAYFVVMRLKKMKLLD